MLKIIPSSRFQALRGDAEALAAQLISRPRVIGAFRAAMLLNLAKTDKKGRRALQLCAREAGRHCVIGSDGLTRFNDRVFSKASTHRLSQWAQNRNSKV